MTNLEQAYNHIENLRIADFFTFVKPFAKDTTSIAMLEKLQKSFILGKTDADFYDQLKSLANLLLVEQKSKNTNYHIKFDFLEIGVSLFTWQMLNFPNNDSRFEHLFNFFTTYNFTPNDAKHHLFTNGLSKEFWLNNRINSEQVNWMMAGLLITGLGVVMENKYGFYNDEIKYKALNHCYNALSNLNIEFADKEKIETLIESISNSSSNDETKFKIMKLFTFLEEISKKKYSSNYL
jgi:hypothetical protein